MCREGTCPAQGHGACRRGTPPGGDPGSAFPVSCLRRADSTSRGRRSPCPSPATCCLELRAVISLPGACWARLARGPAPEDPAVPAAPPLSHLCVRQPRPGSQFNRTSLPLSSLLLGFGERGPTPGGGVPGLPCAWDPGHISYGTVVTLGSRGPTEGQAGGESALLGAARVLLESSPFSP